MLLLSYNPEEEMYFLGLTKEEYIKLANEKPIRFRYETIERDLMSFGIEMKDSFYKDMIKKVYKIENIPFICITTDKEFETISLVRHHQPFHQLYNGYSPWLMIEAVEVKDLNLEDVKIKVKEEKNY